VSALLQVEGLSVQVDSTGKEILSGVDLAIGAGEVVALMGPNGSGKSTLGHVLMGRPGYRVTAGRAVFDGEDLLSLPTWKRARAGLFLAHQYPIEVPGVPTYRALAAVGAQQPLETVLAEAGRVALDERFASWPLNCGLSGGEKKRNEVLQLAVLRPRLAILDEIDTGLDVDGLGTVASRIAEGVGEWGMAVLAITHYARLLEYLPATTVHVMSHGRVVDTGGPELAASLEATGYAGYE
jgi:Fe-S cluster assembly ATP-binding protein